MPVKEKNGEAHISAPQHSAKEDPRIFGPHAIQRGTTGFEEKKGQGAQAPVGVTIADFGFSKDDRLRKRPEFLKVFKNGKRYSGSGLIFFYMANHLERSRIGLDISRKVGKAVRRNRCKRLLREVFRTNRFRLAQDYDLVIRVTPGKRPLEYRNILREFVTFAEKTAGWQKN